MVLEDTSKIHDSEYLQAFHKGKEHFDNNRLEEARLSLEKAYKIKSSDEKVLNLLGMVYFKLNYLEQAEEIYSKLVLTNSSVYVLHSNLGLIRLKLGKFNDAETNLQRALELQPGNPKAQVYLGLLYEKTGDFDKALYHFEKGGAHKLIEQLQERISASQKVKEEIEEADILEVMNKQPAEAVQQAVEEKPPETYMQEEESAYEQEAAPEKEAQYEESMLADEEQEESYEDESAGIKEDEAHYSTVKSEEDREQIKDMAEQLGLEMKPAFSIEESDVEEKPADEFISEEELTEQEASEEEESLEESEEADATKEKENLIEIIEEEREEEVSKEVLSGTDRIDEFVATAKATEDQEEEVGEALKESSLSEDTGEHLLEEEQEEEQLTGIADASSKELASTEEESIEEKQQEEVLPSQEPETIVTVTAPEKTIHVAEEPADLPADEIIAIKPLSLDYFSRDRFYLHPLTGADRFLLVDPHLLEVVLSHEIIIKKGTISSFSGDIKFEHISFGAYELPLIKCQGSGVIFLSHERQEISLFSLNNEEVNIEANHFLIAQGSLSIEARNLISKESLTYLHIKGTGTLGISLKSQPLTLNVLSSMPVNIYSDALIAWSGKLSTHLIKEEELKGIMISYDKNAIPLQFKGIGDVVVEQGCLWGERRTKL